MERVRRAISELGPQEAYLISDRTVELLLQDHRVIRVTAYENLKSGGYSAHHEQAVHTEEDGKHVTVWADVDLPWATGDTVDECLGYAIELMRGP